MLFEAIMCCKCAERSLKREEGNKTHNLKPETLDHGSLYSVYLRWKWQISLLEPYVQPHDLLHVTLFYDRDHTDWYNDAVSNSIEGKKWEITSESICIGPEGVAAGVQMTPKPLEWYEISETAAPHISLAVHPAHQPKELGQMV